MPSAPALRSSAALCFVGVEIGLVGRNDRLLRRQRAGLLERSGQFAGLDLGRFHVGLVERIDAEHRAGHGGRHLEAEEFLADMVDRFHDDADDGMPGRLERLEPVVMRGVVFAFGADIDEEAVVAVKRGIAERLAIDRDQALAFLAGGFGDQLFGPGAEIGDLFRRRNRHLVAAFEAGEPHRQPELHARVFMRRHVGAAGAHHRKRMRDQAANVDAGGSRRHQSERRQHGVAAADRGIAVEDAGKALLGRNLLQRRAGIGDGDEAMAGLVLADGLGDAIEEIILHHVRLGGAAGFAGDDEQRVGEIDRILHRAHLRGIGGIEHMQFREAGFLRKGFRQHFRPEARAAHAEHDGIAEILSLHAAGKILVIGDVGGGGAVQPAQPFVLVVIGPDRFVLLPQAADCCRCAPVLGAFLDGLLDAVAERELLPVDAAAERGRALVRDRAIELVGGIGEQLDAVLDQFFRDGVERDAGFFELFQHVPRVLDIFFEAVARLAMVAECIERCRRHGVDGVGADQFLDIQHVAVVLVLGAGGGPQQALRLGALGRELLPARAGEQALVVLIGQLGVGDGDLALQRAQPLLLAGVVGPCDLVVELLVDRAIDAADEEARRRWRHARDRRPWRRIFRGPRYKPRPPRDRPLARTAA